MNEHLFASRQAFVGCNIKHFVIEVQSFGVKIKHLSRDSKFVIKVSFALINDVGLNCVIRVASRAVVVVDANVLKQNI